MAIEEIKVPCIQCDGLGFKVCPDCSGEGFIVKTAQESKHSMRVGVPSLDVSQKQKCARCDAEGKIVCRICGGTGELTKKAFRD